MTPRPSAQQQAVIDYGLRPLRVTAGAGTGKTFTLVRRMAALMDRHGIRPDEILGVTFTNKAAAELAGRIRSTPELSPPPGMRPEQAIDIFTYHGFAAHLLGTYGALVGLDRGTRIITPAAGRQILHRCVLSAPFRLVDATHVPTVVRKLVNLAGELSDNLRRPEEILAADPVDEVDARRAELATALVMFEDAKKRLGVRDFGDLIHLAVDLVRHPDHRGVVDRVRSQYRCVLLDEYQDTNPAQRELFSTLFGTGRAVTAVGDLDQTIYEWRGASPSNFGHFPTSFPEADGSESRTLRLSVNRRSGQRILDLANRVRARITGSDPADDLVPWTASPPARCRSPGSATPGTRPRRSPGSCGVATTPGSNGRTWRCCSGGTRTSTWCARPSKSTTSPFRSRTWAACSRSRRWSSWWPGSACWTTRPTTRLW